MQVLAGVQMAKAMYLVAVNVALTVESVHQSATIVTDLIFYRFIMRFCEEKTGNTLMSVKIKSIVVLASQSPYYFIHFQMVFAFTTDMYKI